MTDKAQEIDATVPHPARVYNYFLGGTDNFEADQLAAEAAIKTFPKTAESARAARAYLRRVVHYLVTQASIRQFLDIGSGLPSGQNVHQVAQSVAPGTRVVYVDNDPVVQAHAKDLLAGSEPGTVTFLGGDLRDPTPILAQAAGSLDFSQPVAILLHGIIHNISDADNPHAIVGRLMASVPASSYLSICHLTADIYPELIEFARALNERNLDAPLVLRDHGEVSSFFDGLQLVDPGVVQLSKWRPETEAETKAAAALWGGVARK
ncbi:MAG TPA: SAM-dependent methyltransferase [Streptosporangiaceae bacterium]|nr:SAM-dependent methyltransferase [Streptosporangiaceae bacterium]